LAYSELLGVCGIFKHFFGFEFFLHVKHCPHPPWHPLTQAVGCLNNS
jgi:hypothetical protein